MKMKYKRIMAAGMVFVMLCTGTGSAPVYGAQPSVDVDETMYVNLDYYGRVDKINVVKGVGLNGQTEFTDYGTYENVINMSNSIEPVLGDGMVTWQLPEDQRGRFYFKCAVDKGMMVLPWDFDVSYKLNGVPMDGDKLAGASGLIEINVKAEPNDNAGEYYRNNMMLMVAVPVDMGKCYSVEAEGSQTQNLGETTAVVFTALPGEDGDYTVRIGTDSFETTGVIMAMMPGTVEDLEHIKDLKEAKDTWQDAGDELYDSLEQMARSVEDMRQGVGQVRTGLDSAEIARQKWSNSKDSILAGNDQTLASLTSVSQQLETMIPHLQTAKESAEVIHKSMGDIVNTMGEMQDPLRKLHTRLNNIKSSAEGISGNIPELMDLMQQIIPDVKKVGLLYCSAEANSVLQIDMAKEALDTAGIEYEDYTVSNSNEIPTVVESMVGNVDCVYTPTDNMIAAGMATVTMVTNENKLPVICGEKGMVDAGGLATYGIDYYQLGYMTGEQAVKILTEGADISKMPIGYLDASKCELSVNEETAQTLGIDVSGLEK